MRTDASVLHLDLDAFFASVEQRDKPSLRGKPVIVGGTGGRGVVAAASYEARRFGIHSAMSTREARSRCPQAAFLSVRFSAYRAASIAVMNVLRDVSPLVEPLSLDEAFVDLRASTLPSLDLPSLDLATVTACGEELRAKVSQATGGLTASVGVASSKFLAKIATEMDKPDGLTVIEPGSELDVLRPLAVSVIPGVGPATAERLRRAGLHTVGEVEQVSQDELVRLLGKAHGHGLWHLSRGLDDRPVVAEREAKSVSVEGTYDTDLTDRALMEALLTRQAGEVAGRLVTQGLSGRTVSIKVRLHDFTTLSRSSTLPGPTDSATTVARLARALLADLDTSGGVRLLGVGVSGLADWVQEDLFADLETSCVLNPGERAEGPVQVTIPDRFLRSRSGQWTPGSDVVHTVLGRGWVWGAGRGVVTVRFETAETPSGPVRSFPSDDPDLTPWHPEEDESQREDLADQPAQNLLSGPGWAQR